jgi:hypothetical protein
MTELMFIPLAVCALIASVVISYFGLRLWFVLNASRGALGISLLLLLYCGGALSIAIGARNLESAALMDSLAHGTPSMPSELLDRMVLLATFSICVAIVFRKVRFDLNLHLDAKTAYLTAFLFYAVLAPFLGSV